MSHHKFIEIQCEVVVDSHFIVLALYAMELVSHQANVPTKEALQVETVQLGIPK